MNNTLPATAAAVQAGLLLVADGVRSDLRALGYIVTGLFVTPSVQLSGESVVNRSGVPWTVSAFIVVAGVETMFQSHGNNIEAAFAALVKTLPALPEAKG